MKTDDYQTVRIKKIGSSVEEEFVIEVEGNALVCFASNPPANLREGSDCLAAFTFLILDDYKISVSECDRPSSLQRRGEGFAYRIVGQLLDGQLCACGFNFRDEALETEFAYLNGKTISIDVDRIDVDFLK
ncbi:hypothetical protein FAZ69_21890 [Trinickia terrae]|uniref:Uncharacterized protein n=1 Tax=Trinickia terrae TaxID=2571161 RepID=A0A4U1HW97_9BURK|nr:hypothetical protein [Trinickia terrae]TKC85969.1 hypothetical protein FAZ69_21890 [Trinickia terrae]